MKHLRGLLGDDKQIPYFDPLDGGINATFCSYFEAPGPKAIEFGFISRENPDPTARNMMQILNECDVSRRETISWNIVPWYVGGNGRIRTVNQEEINAGIEYLKLLRPLLPKIRVVILVGRKAQKAHLAVKKTLNALLALSPIQANEY